MGGRKQLLARPEFDSGGLVGAALQGDELPSRKAMIDGRRLDSRGEQVATKQQARVGRAGR